MAAAAALRCALLLSLALLSLCGAAAARSVLNREGLPEGKRVLVSEHALFSPLSLFLLSFSFSLS